MAGGPNLDIFRSETGLAPRWVGNADGIESAQTRMKQVAIERPGQYFVWDAYLRRVIDTLDSTNKTATAPGQAKSVRAEAQFASQNLFR